jgi:hypothetical protein
VTTGALSALQLEAITYAAQQHEHFLPDGSRAGFLVGESAVMPTIFIISELLVGFVDCWWWFSLCSNLKLEVKCEMCRISFL